MAGHVRVLTWLVVLVGWAAGHGAAAQDSRSATATAASAPVVRIVQVPLQDGRVSLAALARALLEAYDLDGAALHVPDRPVDLSGTRGRLLLLTARKLLLDTVRFEIAPAGETLFVTIDRERTRELRRRLRSRVVRMVGGLVGEDLLARTCTLDLPAGLDRERPLAVLVHGVESDPEIWSDLRAYLARAERPPQVTAFGYPNDEAIERVAAELAARLRALAPQPIVLVGHSMGGLVARTVVEDPALDPGNVRMLILIGTPNQGSKLAGLRFALEAADLARAPAGGDAFGRALLAGMRANLVDGLGEAGGDLLPESVFLTRLARRERNPKVAYRVVLGSRSVLSEAEHAALCGRAAALFAAHPGAAVAAGKLERWLAGLEEVVDGKGDGAVSLARGRLPGVEAVVLPLDHLGLVRRRGILASIPGDADHPVHTRISGWLGGLR